MRNTIFVARLTAAIDVMTSPPEDPEWAKNWAKSHADTATAPCPTCGTVIPLKDHCFVCFPSEYPPDYATYKAEIEAGEPVAEIQSEEFQLREEVKP